MRQQSSPKQELQQPTLQQPKTLAEVEVKKPSTHQIHTRTHNNKNKQPSSEFKKQSSADNYFRKTATQHQIRETMDIQNKEKEELFYEETYYVSSCNANSLVLISDSMQVLELPVGLIKANINIGEPVKLKVQKNPVRKNNDQINFRELQRRLMEEFKRAESLK